MHCHWLSWPSRSRNSCQVLAAASCVRVTYSRIWFQADRPTAFARTSVPEPIIACPWIFRAWNRKCLVIANEDAFATFSFKGGSFLFHTFFSHFQSFGDGRSALFVCPLTLLTPQMLKTHCQEPERTLAQGKSNWTAEASGAPCYGGVNVQCSWWINNLQEVLGLLWPVLIHVFLWAHYAHSELVTSYWKAPVPQSFVHFLLMPVGRKNLLPFESRWEIGATERSIGHARLWELPWAKKATAGCEDISRLVRGPWL